MYRSEERWKREGSADETKTATATIRGYVEQQKRRGSKTRCLGNKGEDMIDMRNDGEQRSDETKE